MIESIVSSINFYEFHNFLLDQDYYDYIFPFLLIYALLVAVLPRVKIFQTKKGAPMTSIIVVISAIVSFFGVSFTFSSGYSIGNLMMMMFPNISALTIAILVLYIVSATLGYDIFRGHNKTLSAYGYFAMAIIGLGSIVYYVGIVLGAWGTDPFNELARWNTILSTAFIILGFVLLFIKGTAPIGFLLLFVTGSFIAGGAEGSIFEAFIDPFIFILTLVVILMNWVLSGDKDPQRELALKLQDGVKGKKNIEDGMKDSPKPFDSRVYDMIDESFDKNLKEWKKKYGDQDWRSIK